MNQSKFSLADLLTVLTAVVFGFLCFMGANFLYINNDKVWGMSNTIGCLFMAFVCSGALFITAFGAKLLKKTSRNFKTSFILEMILLLLFVLFAVFFASKASPFPHFFNVTAKKSEINSKLQTNIKQAEKMFAEYESYVESRKRNYQAKLNSVVSFPINPTEFRNFGFQDNGIRYSNQIETKMFTFNADLLPTNYSDSISNNGLKEVAGKWLKNAKSTTNSWRPIGIVGVVNDIEKNSNEWLNTLIELSQARQQGESAVDFEYPLSFDDVKAHFTKPDNPSLLSIGLALLAYVLMLLSWFVTKRDGKKNFETMPYEVVL